MRLLQRFRLLVPHVLCWQLVRKRESLLQPGQLHSLRIGNVDAAKEDLTAAANVMDEPEGATPEESQTDAISEPDEDQEMEDILGGMVDEETEEGGEDEISDEELAEIMGLGGESEEEEEPTKPFGNQIITEDEAVEMDK